MSDATAWWPLALLIAIVCGVAWSGKRPKAAPLLHWLPAPLWCYGVPMALRAAGWLPADHAAYRLVTDWVFPVVLCLMLMDVDLAGVARVGGPAVAAMAAGAAGIVLGAPMMLAAFHAALPTEAWKGVGALAATWTGGSLNMIAMRAVLDMPEALFAPLIVVDALAAYTWMALLIASQPFADRINRWLGATDVAAPALAVSAETAMPPLTAAGGVALGVGIALACRAAAPAMPSTPIVSSVTGWSVLLTSTVALGLSTWSAARRVGRGAAPLAALGLYLVLAALGARADVRALAQAPVWLMVGAGCVLIHAICLLAVGKLFRVPLAILATASQANIGGVVSAPAVAAVHRPSLAPVGLLLALLGNAVGTYLGLAAASLARWSQHL